MPNRSSTPVALAFPLSFTMSQDDSENGWVVCCGEQYQDSRFVNLERFQNSSWHLDPATVGPG